MKKIAYLTAAVVSLALSALATNTEGQYCGKESDPEGASICCLDRPTCMATGTVCNSESDITLTCTKPDGSTTAVTVSNCS